MEPASAIGQMGACPARIALAIAVLAAGAMLGGCAPTALRSARTQIQAGHYEEARADLLKLSAESDRLSPEQRREVKDDLCMTGVMIGPPRVSLHSQRRACADAAAEPGSRSAGYLADIDRKMAASDEATVTRSLRDGDLADAEAAAADYANLPGADSTKLAQWSRRMWAMVDSNQKQRRSSFRRHDLARAISRMRNENRAVRAMSPREFHHWVIRTSTVNGRPVAGAPSFHHGVLRLTVPADQLHVAALNLDRFVRINDAAVARCDCDARTEVGIGPGAFPAYVARLSPQEQRSEVLILLSGTTIGPEVSMGVSGRAAEPESGLRPSGVLASDQ